MTTYIKQYGAKRTGTNYLRWLLEANFKDVSVLTNILGWKHGPHPTKVDWSGRDWDHRRTESSAKLAALVTPEIKKAHEDGLIRYCILVKNPYSYYASHVRLWPNEDKSDADYAHDLITTWNTLYTNWLELSKSAEWALVVRFEDLITDKESCLNRISSEFRLSAVGKIIDTNKSLRALNETTMNQKQFIRKKTFDAEFYTGKKYMSVITQEALNAINKMLDPNLMDEFGYSFEGR